MDLVTSRWSILRQILGVGLILIFFAACVAVAFLALGPPPTGLAPNEDKVLHFAAFLMLTLLGGAAFYRTTVLLPALGLFIGGAGIELAQGLSFINREPSWADLAADGAALVVGVLLVWSVKKAVEFAPAGLRRIGLAVANARRSA